MSSILTAGIIGRLEDATNVDSSNDKIPIYQSGQLNAVSPGLLQTYSVFNTETQSATAGTLSESGLSVLAPSSAAVYTLPAPSKAGILKYIASISPSTNNRVTGSGCFIGSTAATSFLFTGVGQGMTLLSLSTTQWLVVGQSTAALST